MAGNLDGGHVPYADKLRGMAVLAVVMLHVSGGWMHEVGVERTAWAVLNVYGGLVRWCVPVFVMLSGMFLLDPKKKVSIADIFFRYILRVLVALLVWGTLYALADHGFSGGRFTSEEVLEALRTVLLGNTHYYLWFLYMIIGLYLITPILRAFVRGAVQHDFHWFFLIAFLVTFLVPTLLALWPNEAVERWRGLLQLNLVLGYVAFYVAGYYLKCFTLHWAVEAILYVLGLLGAVVTVWGTRLLSLQAGQPVLLLCGYFTPNVAAMAVALFVLFRHIPGDRARQQHPSFLSKIAFGIYLAHDFFIMLLRHFGISTLSFAPVLAVPALTAAVFLCSIAVVWPLSKLPLVGKFLT